MIRALDYALLRYLNSWAGVSRLGDAVIVFFAQYLAYVFVAAFLAFLSFGHRNRREKIRIFWVALLSAIVARLGIAELIRFFYHRPRPFLVPMLHANQLLAGSEWAFPSGHAAFFFAVVAAIYVYDKKWGSVFFAATVVMTLARVMAGIHYPSDIAGGVVIGTASAYGVFYFFKRNWPVIS